jgi:hypothetical protein
VTFEGGNPKKFLIFTHGELEEEVKKMIEREKRVKGMVAHPETNLCLLFFTTRLCFLQPMALRLKCESY